MASCSTCDRPVSTATSTCLRRARRAHLHLRVHVVRRLRGGRAAGRLPELPGNFVPRPIRPARCSRSTRRARVRLRPAIVAERDGRALRGSRAHRRSELADGQRQGVRRDRRPSTRAPGREALEQAGASRVAAIGGDTERLRSIGVDARPDRQPGQGPLGGIVTALEELDADLLVVAACDLVSLTAARSARCSRP